MTKYVNDTQWVINPTRERSATTRQRTLSSVSVRGALSVWSECQSRVNESRNNGLSPGSSCLRKGGQHRHAHSKSSPKWDAGQVHGARPGSKNRAEAQGGILQSWESRTDPSNSRIRMTPAYQRPGAGAVLSTAFASAYREAARDSASEGNRSERGNGGGSLSCLIVVIESGRTEAGGSP